MKYVGDKVCTYNFFGKYVNGTVVSVKRSWFSSDEYLVRLGDDIVLRSSDRIYECMEVCDE